jgi:RNA polymerase sigma-70 factor (ECF subfamily)
MTAVIQNWETQRMTSETADELALARCVTSGDEDALNALYERYADPLFAFIYHRLEGARPEETEEVWQDTLSAALRSLPTYRGQSRFFTWLCSIARHKIADHCRRQSRTTLNLSLVPPEDLINLMDNGPLPDEIVRQQATCLRVVEVLGQLPLDYRTALVARYADGQSVDNVAQLLGKSYKATESVLSRAREAFRLALAGQPEVVL